MGMGENKYGTRARTENNVINLRAVKHALNVYFREFSRPVFKASKESLKFDYEIQFRRYDAFKILIFILNILF